MNIEAFAEKNRVKVRRDVDGTDIVPGKFGHIYEHGVEKLGVLFLPSKPMARKWAVVKKTGTAIGMTVRQNDEAEGTLLFDPANPEQARLALKLVRVKSKRVMSEAQRQVLTLARFKMGQTPLAEGVKASKNAETLKDGKQAA